MRRSRRRRGERGSATIVVAVGGVALIAATGLAIDGGMAAGAYRHAQNAADAGALAAARQEYQDLTATPPVVSTTSELQHYAQTEVQHNNAQMVSFGSAGWEVPGSNPNQIYVPTPTSGVSAQATLANISTTVTVTPPLGSPYSADVSLLLNDAQGNIGVAPTAGSSWHGSWSSAIAGLGYANSNSLNQNGYISCMSASASYPAGSTSDNVGTAQPCSTGTIPTGVSAAGSLVSTANPDAEVTTTNVPKSAPSMTVLNETGTNNGITVSANSVQTSDNMYWDPSVDGGMTALAAMSATNLHVATSVVNVDASTLNFSLKVDYNPATGHPDITPQCAGGTISFTQVVGGLVKPVTQNADCSLTGLLPSIPGVTITPAYYQPSPLDYNHACTYSNATQVWTCSQIQACMLLISYPSPATSVCLGQLTINFAVQPATTITMFGGTTVTATVPQTTYFMRALGWNQTSPKASATADIEAVVDESNAAFALTPFGMPAVATEMDAPYNYLPLQVGHQYYLYGPNMQSYSYSAAMGSGWQGQLDPASPHRVGKTAKATTTLNTSPHGYDGSSFYVEPVFDPTTGVILYYAIFKPVASNIHYGTLVNSVPSLGGPLIQANSVTGWTVLNQGAVSIKLVQ